MSIRAKTAAIWASAQYLIILAALLAISVGLNFWQLKRAWQAPLRAEVAAERDASKKSSQLLDDLQDRAQRLLDASDTVAGTMQQATKDYRRAVEQRPLDAQCAPGQERMDAVNKGLGQSQPDTGARHEP